MRFFAYYLPQFHCIPENDKWWGKGFTEWTKVKNAKPLYKTHIQPKHPLNDNYYSLDNIETLIWQAKLMEDFSVDGLIFYHYYFTGKKLLEKPAEMLLQNKDVDIQFFFCWANHSWFRTWEGSKELLIEQQYGDKKEWESHFDYLLQFFKDKRYQKKDNRPILMIFKSEFEEKKLMFEYFNDRCIENGFDGICIIETVETYDLQKINESLNENIKYEKYIHIREPGASIIDYFSKFIHFPERLINKIKVIMHKVKIYNGDKFTRSMAKKHGFDKRVIRGAFFEWDNTPRHSNRGYIITSPHKDSFMKYLDSIKNDDYVFINAWNEWAEGMILEPTEENKYKYLEWIKEWKEKPQNEEII